MNKKVFTLALGFLLLLSGTLVVGTGEATQEKNIELTEENEAFFAVEILEYTEEVKLGDEVDIKYSVTNTGTEEGIQDIVLSVEDEEFHRDTDVTLAPGEEWINEITYDTEDVDVPWFFIEFSTDLSLLLESNDDSHSGKITVTQPMLDIPGFTFVLLPLGMILAVVIYHTKKR